MRNATLFCLCLLGSLACFSSEIRGSSTVSQTDAENTPLWARTSAPAALALTSTEVEALALHVSAIAPPSPAPNAALPTQGEAPPVLVDWRPDESAFAVSTGRTVSIVPVLDGEPRLLPNVSQNVHALVFSPKGDRFATALESGKVLIWDPSSAELISELPHIHTGYGYAIAFSPDSKLIAVADSNATVWDIDQNTKLCSTDSAWVFELAFTPDQGSLVTTGAGDMAIWDPATCIEKVRGSAETGGTFDSWVSPDTRYLAAAAPYGHGLSLYDGRSLQLIAELTETAGCEDHVGPARFSRDGQILLASGSYRWFRSFRVDSREMIVSYDVPRADEVSAIVMFDDGERLFVNRGDKGEIIDAVSKMVTHAIDTKGADTFDLSWDMKHLLGVSEDTAYVWDTEAGTLVTSYSLPR